MKTETEVPSLGKDEFTGKVFGRFEVLCKLGEGGMSQVFLAWQKSVGGFRRAVVLKRILASIRNDKAFLRMFLQEAKITSGLSHGNIAALHDLSHEGAELFMVIEFVPGATLVEVAKACATAREPIPIGLTVAAVRDVALALHYAHTFKDNVGRSKPVIHRDIAEKNIMVAFDGTTKLLDFGIAQQQGRPGHTQVGMVKGTAGYMSPEQVKGEPLDGRTDVFSLGVVLHELLTGQRLFRRENSAAEINALLMDPIPAPSQKNKVVSMELDAVVLKALSRQREHRFATARELALALDRAASRQMWDGEQRAIFIQRHFPDRQRQIQALLGDPGKTDLGDLVEEEEEEPLGARDALKTVTVSRDKIDRAVAVDPTGEGTVEVDEEERALLTAGLDSTEEAETIHEDKGSRLLRWKSRRTRESALSPALLAAAGTGAVILAVILMLLLSKG